MLRDAVFRARSGGRWHPAFRRGDRRRLPRPGQGRRLPADRHQLTVRGEVEGLDDEQFLKIAQEAEAGCPVSKALSGVEITLDAAQERA